MSPSAHTTPIGSMSTPPPTSVSGATPAAATRGSNQSDMRAYNERLILSLIRASNGLAKAELARRTGLSAQTTSVIMRALERDELLLRGEPIRGRVGQPSVPLSINPKGAYFFGLHIGRRRVELVLLDFGGTMLNIWHAEYPYPVPGNIIAFVQESLRESAHLLNEQGRERIAGLGIAMPFGLWNWADHAGAPQAILHDWENGDFRTELAAQLPFPVFLENDATAACSAELVFGSAATSLHDFIYLFVDTFVGGGIVIKRGVFRGQTGNAGAIGSMLVPDRSGKTCQLIDLASLVLLEEQVRERGEDSSVIWRNPEHWGVLEQHCDEWIDTAAHGLACAIVNTTAVLDVDGVVLDGLLPDVVRTRLINRVRQSLAQTPSEGLALPPIYPGTLGMHASAIGGASLPLTGRFLVENHNVSKP